MRLENVGGLKGSLLKWMEDFLNNREMRTVIKDEKSEWCSGESGVHQESVLTPKMYLVYINDMTEAVNSYMSLFADDAKLLRKIVNKEDCEPLQKYLDKIHRWGKLWQIVYCQKGLTMV